jgi:hypothetical protein
LLFLPTPGSTFQSMERALWLLQEQQNREMESASHLALSDPAKIADLVHSHLDQRRLVEERWGCTTSPTTLISLSNHSLALLIDSSSNLHFDVFDLSQPRFRH